MTADQRTVFISYARADAAVVLALAQDLRAAGIPIWLDQLDIAPGVPWDAEIQRALGASGTVLCMLSPHAVDSENVLDEISMALDGRKRVVPVRLGDCEIPLRLRRRQYVDLVDGRERGLQRLIGALRDAGGAAPATPAPPPLAASGATGTPAARTRRRVALAAALVAVLVGAGGLAAWFLGAARAGRGPSLSGGPCAAILQPGVQLVATHRGPSQSVEGFLSVSRVAQDAAGSRFTGTMSFVGLPGVEVVTGEWTGDSFLLLRPNAEMQRWEGRCGADGRIEGRWSWAHRPDDHGPFTIGP